MSFGWWLVFGVVCREVYGTFVQYPGWLLGYKSSEQALLSYTSTYFGLGVSEEKYYVWTGIMVGWYIMLSGYNFVSWFVVLSDIQVFSRHNTPSVYSKSRNYLLDLRVHPLVLFDYLSSRSHGISGVSVRVGLLYIPIGGSFFCFGFGSERNPVLQQFFGLCRKLIDFRTSKKNWRFGDTLVFGR